MTSFLQWCPIYQVPANVALLQNALLVVSETLSRLTPAISLETGLPHDWTTGAAISQPVETRRSKTILNATKDLYTSWNFMPESELFSAFWKSFSFFLSASLLIKKTASEYKRSWKDVGKLILYVTCAMSGPLLNTKCKTGALFSRMIGKLILWKRWKKSYAVLPSFSASVWTAGDALRTCRTCSVLSLPSASFSIEWNQEIFSADFVRKPLTS